MINRDVGIITHSDRVLLELREKQVEYQIETFVLDFLDIWAFIHEQIKHQTLDTTLEFLRSIWDSHTYPLYQKYKQKGVIKYNKEWGRDFASIIWQGKPGGWYLIPHGIFLYELYGHEEGLLDDFLQKLATQAIKGTGANLYEILMPRIANIVPDYDETDIEYLKTTQRLRRTNKYGPYIISQKEYAKQLGVTIKTVQRRTQRMNQLQNFNTLTFVDMAKLGYETYLLFHQKSFPRSHPNVILSANMNVGNFSILQIPLQNQQLLKGILDTTEVHVIRPVNRRIVSWNLTGLTSGKETWKGSLPFSDPTRKIVLGQPDIEYELIPSNERFRQLTEADFKILDYMAYKGWFNSITEFSRALKMSRTEVSKRLTEYSQKKFIQYHHYFFKLNLTSQWFFVSDEDKNNDWVNHLRLFPLAFLFSSESESPYTHFGYVKMPSKWITPMIRRMDNIKRELGVKFYLKPYSDPDIFAWGVSLADTYPKEEIRS